MEPECNLEKFVSIVNIANLLDINKILVLQYSGIVRKFQRALSQMVLKSFLLDLSQKQSRREVVIKNNMDDTLKIY